MNAPLFEKKSFKLAGTRRTALDVARNRLMAVSIIFALAYIFLAARVFDLSFMQGAMQQAGESRELAAASIENKKNAIRNDIFDRNGVLLATTLRTASLYADPATIVDPEKTAQALVSAVPDLSYGEVLQKLQRPGRFVWIKRNITPAEKQKILFIGDPGLQFREELRRIYPQGNLFSHVVGYTDIDGHGLAGVERSFNKFLTQGAGTIRLSLDLKIQHILHRELAAALQSFNAKGAAGVILDVSNGDVLAAVSLPDFDPQNPGASGADSLFNNTTLGVFELGSVFKIFSTAAYLETYPDGMSSTFDAREPLKRGRFTISDFHPEKRILSTAEVFMHSSNIGSALMGEAVGAQALRDFYDDLGLLSQPAIEIEEVGRPLYPQPWRDINTTTAAFGHGLAVSPLQMVAAAASIVGDGSVITPRFVLEEGAVRKDGDEKPSVHLFSPQTVHQMRQLMRLVVTDGTGVSADVPGYQVGGKTGTAEQPGPKGYDRKKLVSSFMGFFPMNAPRYAIFVMLNEPKGNKASFGYATGGWVAAPAVAKIIKGMATVLGIEPQAVDTAQDMAAPLKKYIAGKDTEGRHLASY